MPVNIKRGFNRIFVVLTVLWAAYCLFGIPTQMQRAAFDIYLGMERPCWDARATSNLQLDQQLSKDCNDFAMKMYQDALTPWEWKNYYRTKWPFILAGVVLVPLAVYAVCRTVGSAWVWIVRGFRQEE